MNDQEQVDELLAVTGENTSGRDDMDRGVPPAIQRERRRVLSRLMATGLSEDDICTVMGAEINPDGKPGFGMSTAAVKRLMRKVLAQWDEEDAERDPYLRAAAKRRLADYTREAAKDRSWTAVANLEKVRAGVEGTLEQEESVQPVDSRLSDALLVVLREEDPSRVRELVQRGRELAERQRLGAAAPAPELVAPIPAEKITVQRPDEAGESSLEAD